MKASAITASLAVLISEKRPRHYADDYLRAKNKAERQAIADSVPAKYKEMVQLHIKIIKDKQKWSKAR